MEGPITEMFYAFLQAPACEGTGTTFNGIELCAIVSEDLTRVTIESYRFVQFRERVCLVS